MTTEAQQRRRAVLILYCTLTLTHYMYALLLGTVMSDFVENKKKLFQLATRTFSNPPGPTKNLGKPTFERPTFLEPPQQINAY